MKNRIVLIDALRGYALMGLFLVHMIEYYELYWYKPEASVFKDFVFYLFGGKAYAIFGLLFGLSFFIIMDGQKENPNFKWRFAWRLILLLIAGFLHGLLYGGDVLQVLAVAGFVLIILFSLKNSHLIAIAALFLLQTPTLLYVILSNTMLEQPLHWSLLGKAHEVYALGSLADVIKINAWTGFMGKWAFMLEDGRLSTIIGISTLGFWLGKVRFFKETDDQRKKYQSYLVISILIASTFLIGKPYIRLIINPDEYWMIDSIINSYINLMLVFVSILAFLVFYQISFFNKILKSLAPSGKMSLTIYISQSMVFIPVFYNFGLGMYKSINQQMVFVLGIIFWAMQIWLAKIWIKRYHYGPFEWVWRSATYLRKDVPLKRS